MQRRPAALHPATPLHSVRDAEAAALAALFAPAISGRELRPQADFAR